MECVDESRDCLDDLSDDRQDFQDSSWNLEPRIN